MQRWGSLVRLAYWEGTPETQDANIHTDEDVVYERKDSADIMKESRSMMKWGLSRISLVKMSLGLMTPGMWWMATSSA